ncbi:SDR family oxidoreductase [Streptacidiphilus fuscans]|uniref:SDR family oxidoreductase n=1 Tax=Streptacidiphilus fuscans TaxID=2789292 RepID=A0A931B5S5_9ACTN|nr:SDR family oxidoreductase [Streptacidiphilus fuscans]MBF9070706.1 SDR family oxidoreductase [Streptacidiphilus fuscans]
MSGGLVVVTGGTGVLGRAVVERLVEQGREVRVVSRRPASGGERPYGWAVADLRSGSGVAEALAGADVVVHCATAFGRGQEAALARNLVAGAQAAGEGAARAPHVIYVSIVGIDRIPFGYYKGKLESERVFARSGLPYTIQRATQFHDLVRTLFAGAAKLPLVPVPSVRFQPIDVRDVAVRLAELAAAEPACGRAPDIGGPAVREARDLARAYLAATGREGRPLLPLSLPGRAFGALRAGANLVPGEPYGRIGFEEYLAGLPAPKRLAYRKQ